MAETLRLEIATPDGLIFSEDVTMVTLPCIDGQLGIYPRHVPLITEIVPGEVVIHRPSPAHDAFLAIGGGLVDIEGDRIEIVADMAVAAEHIDEAKAEEAHRRAEARLQERLSDEEVASVNASLVRSLAQLQVKRRRRQ